jgi:hypothetical protein
MAAAAAMRQSQHSGTDAWACESCDAVFAESNIPPPDENNFRLCSCSAPVSRAADDNM